MVLARKIAPALFLGIGWLCLGASLSIAAPPSARSLSRYRLLDLGGPYSPAAFGIGIVATCVNQRGQVVGTSDTDKVVNTQVVPVAVLWQGRQRTRLSHPGSRAMGINARGEVVGTVVVRVEENLVQMENGGEVAASPGAAYSVTYHAFLWRPGRGMQDLMPAELGDGEATCINAKGQIVGSIQTPEGKAQAVLWEKGRMHRLDPAGDQSSRAYGINLRGQIVGDYGEFACLWHKGKRKMLGSLAGGSSTAFSISDQGRIVGEAAKPIGPQNLLRAVLFQKGKVQSLPMLAGYSESTARSINRQGDIVGAVRRGEGVSRAVLWRRGRVYDLNALIAKRTGWVLVSAQSINDRGQIVGYGFKQGRQRAFLLNPR